LDGDTMSKVQSTYLLTHLNSHNPSTTNMKMQLLKSDQKAATPQNEHEQYHVKKQSRFIV
jgi:hypothetical protein